MTDEGGRTALELIDAWIEVYKGEQAHGADHRHTLHSLRDVRRLVDPLSSRVRELEEALEAALLVALTHAERIRELEETPESK